jgi:hypothetical protein
VAVVVAAAAVVVEEEVVRMGVATNHAEVAITLGIGNGLWDSSCLWGLSCCVVVLICSAMLGHMDIKSKNQERAPKIT